MADIEPIKNNLEKIFDQNYKVDFYQREYKWNDKEQKHKPVTSLLDDIFLKFEIQYNPEVDVKKENIDKFDWYYLSTIMTNEIQGVNYIVDGQQRLTTLTIIQICLYKLAKKYKLQNYSQDIERRIFYVDRMEGKIFRINFEKTNKAFKNILNIQENNQLGETQLSSRTEENIKNAYDIIYEYLNNKLNTEHKFRMFTEYFYSKIIIIDIKVKDVKDVPMMFEIINDRGVDLRPYEILKGKILGKIKKEDISNYLEIWEDAIETLDEKDRDLFLSTYFQSRYSNTTTEYRELWAEKYYKTIYQKGYEGKILLKETEDVKKFVKVQLMYYSRLFKKIKEDIQAKTKEEDDEGKYVWFNNVNGQDTYMFMLMSAIGYKNISNEDLNLSSNDIFEKIKDDEYEEKYKMVSKLFDKFYVAMNLNNVYESRDFGISMIELGQSIRNNTLEEIEEKFNKKIKETICTRSDKAEANIFNYELFKRVGYQNLSKKFLRYFFARIDMLIAKGAKLTNIPSYNNLINVSNGNEVYHIEHILANDDTQVNMHKFENEEEFITERNRLGGLLLLKGKDNQASGNELYPEKLKTYEVKGTYFAQTLRENFYHSNPGFIEWCKNNNLEFKSYEKIEEGEVQDIYGKEAIEERSKLLFQLTKMIWE